MAHARQAGSAPSRKVKKIASSKTARRRRKIGGARSLAAIKRATTPIRKKKSSRRNFIRSAGSIGRRRRGMAGKG